MKLVPLGDQAVLAYLPDEAAAVRLAAAVRGANPPWLQDVVPAYASVGVFFDADAVTPTAVRQWLTDSTSRHPTNSPPHQLATSSPSATSCTSTCRGCVVSPGCQRMR